jgi:beta-1,4-mannosyltransferase
VLPYAEMLNSGAALLALSLRRPILVPRNDVNDLLAAEVGEAWVQRFDGPLEAADLLRALAAVRAAGLASAAPDLTRRSWDGVGESHAAVYAEVLAQVRGR